MSFSGNNADSTDRSHGRRAGIPIDVRFTFVLVALFGTLCLGGCISHTPYPASWPSHGRQPTDHCEPMLGSFENVGSWAASQDMDERLLAGLFFPLRSGEPMTNHQERRDVTHVTFDDCGNGDVMVTGWISHERRFERLLTTQDLACQQGYWIFRDSGWEVEGSVGAVGRVSSRYEIALAEDGSLIMKQNELGGGVIFMIVPIGTKATTWLKFAPLRVSTQAFRCDPRRSGVKPARAAAKTL